MFVQRERVIYEISYESLYKAIRLFRRSQVQNLMYYESYPNFNYIK